MAAATAATQLPEGRLEKWRASTVRLPAATRLLAAAYRDFGPVQFAWDGEPAAVQAAGLAWLAGTLVERAAYWAQATVYTYLVDRRADPVAMAVLSRRQADSTLARLDAVPWFGRFVTGYATAPYKLGWRTYTRWTAYTDLCATMAAADMAAHAAEGYWVIELVATEPSVRRDETSPSPGPRAAQVPDGLTWRPAPLPSRHPPTHPRLSDRTAVPGPGHHAAHPECGDRRRGQQRGASPDLCDRDGRGPHAPVPAVWL